MKERALYLLLTYPLQSQIVDCILAILTLHLTLAVGCPPRRIHPALCGQSSDVDDVDDV